MIYFLDTADINAIKHCNEFYPIAGVTTNPSIVARTGADFWTLLKSIRNIIGEEKMLHVQTRSQTAEGMIEEALLLKKNLGDNFYIKIPICEEGLKATSALKAMGINVTVTAIFSPTQALLAARAGADFVAPYVNRIDSICGDGVKVVEEIANIFAINGIKTQILAASFKNTEQVHKCALVGCHSATVTDETLKGLISHPMTDNALMKFDNDWKAVYGDKTILQLD